MVETFVARSYFDKVSIFEASLVEIMAVAELLDYSMSDLEYIVSYQQAAVLARRMCCKSVGEYKHRWDQNLHLPYFPEIFYSGRGWKTGIFEEIGWDDFLFPHPVELVKPKSISGMLEKLNPHQDSVNQSAAALESKIELESALPLWLQKKSKEFYSYEEAISVNRKAGIQTIGAYSKSVKNDIRLPKDPEQYYGAKFAWYYFLGLYQMSEAMAIIRRAGIYRRIAYRQLAKKDKRLPSKPSIYGQVDCETVYELINTAWSQKEIT